MGSCWSSARKYFVLCYGDHGKDENLRVCPPNLVVPQPCIFLCKDTGQQVGIVKGPVRDMECESCNKWQWHRLGLGVPKMLVSILTCLPCPKFWCLGFCWEECLHGHGLTSGQINENTFHWNNSIKFLKYVLLPADIFLCCGNMLVGGFLLVVHFFYHLLSAWYLHWQRWYGLLKHCANECL